MNKNTILSSSAVGILIISLTIVLTIMNNKIRNLEEKLEKKQSVENFGGFDIPDKSGQNLLLSDANGNISTESYDSTIKALQTQINNLNDKLENVINGKSPLKNPVVDGIITVNCIDVGMNIIGKSPVTYIKFTTNTPDTDKTGNFKSSLLGFDGEKIGPIVYAVDGIRPGIPVKIALLETEYNIFDGSNGILNSCGHSSCGAPYENTVVSRSINNERYKKSTQIYSWSLHPKR